MPRERWRSDAAPGSSFCGVPPRLGAERCELNLIECLPLGFSAWDGVPLLGQELLHFLDGPARRKSSRCEVVHGFLVSEDTLPRRLYHSQPIQPFLLYRTSGHSTSNRR